MVCDNVVRGRFSLSDKRTVMSGQMMLGGAIQMALQCHTENSPLQSCSGLLEVIRLIYVAINQSAEEPF